MIRLGHESWKLATMSYVLGATCTLYNVCHRRPKYETVGLKLVATLLQPSPLTIDSYEADSYWFESRHKYIGLFTVLHNCRVHPEALHD